MTSMETVTITKKQLRNLVKKQEAVDQEVRALRGIVLELAKDEVRPAFVKRLERISKSLDRGEGKRFSSLGAFKAHLRAL